VLIDIKADPLVMGKMGPSFRLLSQTGYEGDPFMTVNENMERPVRFRRACGRVPLPCLISVFLGVTIPGALALPVAAADVKVVVVDVVAVADGYRASKLRGTTVVNSKNEKIGEIDDLVVGKDRVLFAIIQVGGFLGLGSRLIAVPYTSLQISDDGRRIVLPGATKQQLEQVPEFKYR
jgi:sporulation protein YlmC with PRC-barrel domain